MRLFHKQPIEPINGHFPVTPQRIDVTEDVSKNRSYDRQNPSHAPIDFSLSRRFLIIESLLGLIIGLLLSNISKLGELINAIGGK
jgi:hypothetical protein